jgi:DDE family transposase
MFDLLRLCFGLLVRLFHSRESLPIENLVLRQQLAVFKRRHSRPRLAAMDKLFWVALRRFWSSWKKALIVVTPDTVVRWHRAGFQLYWRLLSRAQKQLGRRPVRRVRSPFYGPERFTYQPESNSYRCPAGQQLNYGGRNLRNRTYAYIGTRKRCGACALKARCTSGPFRFLAIHMDEAARQRARELASTPEFPHAQRQRKKVEALFPELKNQIGLRRLRLRRLKFVREQFWLAAAAQNIKRLVRFLSQRPQSILQATT